MTTARAQETSQVPARPQLRRAGRPSAGAQRPATPLPASSSTPVCVRVLSRSSITRLGVRALLREFADRVDVVGRDSQQPGVVLLEMTTGDLAQSGVLRHLTRESTPVVVLIADVSSATAGRATAMGAVACVSLQSSGSELLCAIEAAAAGVDTARPARRRSGPTTADARPGRAQLSTGPAPGDLTAREWEVLSLVASGVSNADIAATLYLSINSIKTYVRTGYRKIGVRTRTQAVLWYVDLRTSQGLSPTLGAPSSALLAHVGG